MTVKRVAGWKWAIVGDGGEIIEVCDTNAQAWYRVEVLSFEPSNNGQRFAELRSKPQ